MPVSDSRKQFILTTAANYFGLPVSDESLAALQDQQALDTFLDDGSTPVLAARLDGKNIALTTKIDPGGGASSGDGGDDGHKTMVFYRVRPDVITPNNLHTNVFVSSMLESPVSALYHAVHQMYVPLLLQDDRYNKDLDPKLQSLLTELEAGLGSVLRKKDPATRGVTAKEDSVAGILTPTDEFQYWGDVAMSSRGDDKERALHFQSLFQPISKEYAGLDAMPLAEALELVEQTQDTLDDIWKQTEFEKPYPETRMRHLIQVIAGALCLYVQHALASHDLWKGSFAVVKEALRCGQSLCERWVQACDTLVVQFWKRYGSHPWKGDKVVLDALLQFAKRLEEIVTLRAVHEQIVRLLSTQEQQELRTTDAFAPFAGLRPLQYNPYTAPLWRAAVAQYDRAMSPAEQRIASKLRQQIRGLESNCQQLLREFERYRELVRRPGLSKELITERETLLGQLSVYVRQTRDSFMQKTGAGGKGVPKGKNMPDTVNNIVWVRQLEAKVQDMLKVAEDLLGDLSGFRNFHKDATDLLEELHGWKQETFSEWTRDVQQQIDDKDNTLSLETHGRLMELNAKDGKLYVNYSERLVTLLREVRTLTSLGFAIPAKIQHTSQVGQKFYRHGVILKQVAHFYNTIDQQMIPSQQSMMLEMALAFERLVKNPKAGSKNKGEGVQVTWDNPEELEAYIQKLQTAADNLTRENRRLRKCHFTISEKVVQMMGTDLLRQQQKWKDMLMEIRQIMANLVQQGFVAEHMKPWKAHWDRQLYKAIEHQYQMGLEALNEDLPEIKVELTYSRQRIQFRPPLEEIKAKYYREMKKFISIPNQFKGVGESTENLIFTAIIDRNASGFITCYKKAAELFKNLESVQDIFKEWVVLGALDLDDFAFQNLHDLSDWEKNFKAIKTRGRDAEKLPNEVKVDCIRVSTTPIKAVIDDHMQRLFDALLASLRKSIQTDVTEIDTFLTTAMETLSQRPQTVEEIGEANGKHVEYAKKKKVPTATLR